MKSDCLDIIEQLGNFIEIEKMIEFSGNKNKTREECIKLLSVLLSDSKIENRKYGDLTREILNKK